MRYLITGGCGFIGSHIVDRLLTLGNEVAVVDVWKNPELTHQYENPNYHFFKGSILDTDILKEASKEADYYIHMAAILGTSETIEIYDVEQVAMTNIIGTLRLLKNARINNVKRVILPVTPDAPWLNPYKITKNAIEKFCQLYYKEYNVENIGLKLGNIYGPRERWIGSDPSAVFQYQKVIPTFIIHALQNEKIPIFGDGHQKSEYIFIDDVVDAFMKAIEANVNAIGKIIPIGIGVQTSVLQIVEVLERLLQKDLEINYLPMRKGEIKIDLRLDISMAKELLNFSAQYNLFEGLKATIPYYIERLKNNKL